MPTNHQALIEQCKRGNENSQLKLYKLYCSAMFNIAYRYLKDEEEAKDDMQESFLKAFLKLNTFIEKISFGSWLKRIVINHCLDVLKRKKLETIPLRNAPLEIVNDDDWQFESSITKEMIVDAIESLSEKYGLILKLYLIEGYDHVEISEVLQIPAKTSRTILHRGKLQLREILKEKRYATRY